MTICNVKRKGPGRAHAAHRGVDAEGTVLVEAVRLQLVRPHGRLVVVPGGADEVALMAGHDAVPVALTGALYKRQHEIHRSYTTHTYTYWPNMICIYVWFVASVSCLAAWQISLWDNKHDFDLNLWVPHPFIWNKHTQPSSSTQLFRGNFLAIISP